MFLYNYRANLYQMYILYAPIYTSSYAKFEENLFSSLQDINFVPKNLQIFKPGEWAGVRLVLELLLSADVCMRVCVCVCVCVFVCVSAPKAINN